MSCFRINYLAANILCTIFLSNSIPALHNASWPCPSFCTCKGDDIAESCTLAAKFEYHLLQGRKVNLLNLKNCTNFEDVYVNVTVMQLVTRCPVSLVKASLTALRRLFPNMDSFVNINGTTMCVFRLKEDESSWIEQQSCSSNFSQNLSQIITPFSSKFVMMNSLNPGKDHERTVSTLLPNASRSLWLHSNMTAGVSSFSTFVYAQASWKDFLISVTHSSSQNAVTATTMLSISVDSLYLKPDEDHYFKASQTLLNDTTFGNGTYQRLILQTDVQYRFLTIILSSSLSGVALLLNISALISLCTCQKITLVRVFGISLMFFNCMLALYGAGMSFYLYFSTGIWELRFCQGLTSLKLFSLGSIIWTLIMLTFHHSIRQSSDDERDSIFKGIVYIFEGMMLVGVFAVLSWIKLSDFQYMCALITPETTVEFILVGLEIWHYSSLFLLAIRYPIYKIWKLKHKEKLESRKSDGEHPILAIIVISLMIWIGAYSFTYFSELSIELKASIRHNSLLAPSVLHPLLFSSKSTLVCVYQKCLCRKARKTKHNDGRLMSCSCQDQEACSVCEHDIHLDTLNLPAYAKQTISTTKHIDKERKDNTTTPVLVCRSPVQADRRNRKSFSLSSIASDIEELNKSPVLPTNQNNKTRSQTSIESLDNSTPSQSVHEAKTNCYRRSQTPSFIVLGDNMDRKSASGSPKLAVINPNVDKKKLFINKSEKESDVSLLSSSEGGRVSRGPTFYPIKQKPQEDDKKKTKSRKIKSNSNSAPAQQPKALCDSDEIYEAESFINASSAETAATTSEECTHLTISNQKRNSQDSLEWDPGYSISTVSPASDDARSSQRCSQLERETNKDELYARSMSSSGKQTLAHSVIAITDYEWEPYGVDEPNSGRVSESKRRLLQTEKTSSEDSSTSEESIKKPAPLVLETVSRKLVE